MIDEIILAPSPIGTAHMGPVGLDGGILVLPGACQAEKSGMEMGHVVGQGRHGVALRVDGSEGPAGASVFPCRPTMTAKLRFAVVSDTFCSVPDRALQ